MLFCRCSPASPGCPRLPQGRSVPLHVSLRPPPAAPARGRGTWDTGPHPRPCTVGTRPPPPTPCTCTGHPQHRVQYPPRDPFRAVLVDSSDGWTQGRWKETPLSLLASLSSFRPVSALWASAGWWGGLEAEPSVPRPAQVPGTPAAVAAHRTRDASTTTRGPPAARGPPGKGRHGLCSPFCPWSPPAPTPREQVLVGGGTGSETTCRSPALLGHSTTWWSPLVSAVAGTGCSWGSAAGVGFSCPLEAPCQAGGPPGRMGRDADAHSLRAGGADGR